MILYRLFTLNELEDVANAQELDANPSHVKGA